MWCLVSASCHERGGSYSASHNQRVCLRGEQHICLGPAKIDAIHAFLWRRIMTPSHAWIWMSFPPSLFLRPLFCFLSVLHFHSVIIHLSSLVLRSCYETLAFQTMIIFFYYIHVLAPLLCKYPLLWFAIVFALSRHEENLIPLMHLICAWDYCTMKTCYTFQNSNLPPHLLKPAAKTTGSVLPHGMMSHCRMCQRRTASTAMHQCLCLSFPLFPILAPCTGQSRIDLTVRTHWSSYCIDGV